MRFRTTCSILNASMKRTRLPCFSRASFSTTSRPPISSSKSEKVVEDYHPYNVLQHPLATCTSPRSELCRHGGVFDAKGHTLLAGHHGGPAELVLQNIYQAQRVARETEGSYYLKDSRQQVNACIRKFLRSFPPTYLPASMCSYCSRSFRMWMADLLEKNISLMKSAVLRSMGMNGLVGSARLICDTSISSPTCTTFNGDLQS